MAQNPKPDDISPDAVLKDEAQDTPSNSPDDRGGLPEGVRGTTRDVDHTVPAEEHAGYPDPNKPDLRKP